MRKDFDGGRLDMASYVAHSDLYPIAFMGDVEHSRGCPKRSIEIYCQ